MLRLSKKSDYALIAMKHLAMRPDGGASARAAAKPREGGCVPPKSNKRPRCSISQRDSSFNKSMRSGSGARPGDGDAATGGGA